MKKILSLLMAFLMLFGTISFAENTETDPLATILSGMTLRDKVAQMMIASFRVWKEVPPEGAEQPAEEPPKVNITELNEEIREMVSRNHFGGILLFGENISDAEQTLRLISDFQTTNQAGGGLPQIFFADQEGGSISRISYGTQGIGNMALGATGDPENARTTAAAFGEELSLLGIRADFAPVVDVNNNPMNPVIGIRSFSDNPQVAAEFGKAYIQGLHDAGVISTAKHFPGHGNTDTDSHTGAPVINKTYEELQACELIPFRAAIDAGVDIVMTAHIQYPQVEPETYSSISTGKSVYLPATMSKTILQGILREDMGFDGVIVTDALDMSAITDHFALEDTIKLTINAGADLLILPTVKDTNLFRLTETYVDTAVALAESGEIDEKRIEESVLRILKLKQKYGILDQTDFAVTEEKIAAAREGVGSAAHRETEWQIVGKALTVYKNENNAFPLNVKSGEKTLILFADSCASRAGAGDLARQMLEEKQALPEGAEIVVMKNTRDNEAECIQAAKEADHVILVHRVYSLACLNPEKDDGFSSGTFDKIIPAVHEAGKTVIVVSCQLPYDATRFPDADAVLLTWWGSAMREMLTEGSTWSVNLPAGLLACFGACPAEGASPVELPALDDQYRPAAKHSEGDDEVIRSQIERAVVSYAANGTRDEEALSALASLNPSLGEKWMRIMDLWETPVTVNEALPDGLPDDDSLCLVGLGFQLNPDGTMREELVERLKVMLAASEKYPNAVIVCTGGGTAADDQTATEAGRMAEWLEANGVNPSRLIVEDHSLTTAQNAIYTFNILSERYPQVKQIAMISSDYHIATGTLLFGAEAILRGSAIEVVSNASWHAPGGTLSVLFQAGALIELSGDVETAFEIYYETYDIHELPPLHQETAAES